MNKKNINKTTEAPLGYGFYSNVLHKPFECLIDLEKAEEVYFAELKAKEDKVAQKKADAKKVEDTFKALNAARKTYKEDLTQLTKEYAESLENLQKAFDLGKKDIHSKLAAAEDAFSAAHKEFTEKYPEGYHLTLKDGDFETTLSGKTATTETPKSLVDLTKIFDLLFGF